MKKLILFVLVIIVSNELWAQDQTTANNPNSRKDNKKKEKRDKINRILKLEEEGEPGFRKHSIFGFKLNTDGWGGSYELGKIKTPYKATLYQLEFNEKKHPKESKQSSQKDVGGFILLGNPFVYGKQNIFYQLKLGLGQQIMIGGKGNKNGVGVYGLYAGGFSAGLLRPYYVSVDDGSGFEREIKYTQQDSALFLGQSIVGGTGLAKGWGELKFVPGLHAKGAIRFDWGRFNNTITAVELGFNFEYYTQKIVQMVNVPGKNFFTNAYISILFGSRK